MIRTDGRPTIAWAPLPEVISNRDPGDEHNEPPIPMRCPTCDRYCGGRCPTIRKEKS